MEITLLDLPDLENKTILDDIFDLVEDSPEKDFILELIKISCNVKDDNFNSMMNRMVIKKNYFNEGDIMEFVFTTPNEIIKSGKALMTFDEIEKLGGINDILFKKRIHLEGAVYYLDRDKKHFHKLDLVKPELLIEKDLDKKDYYYLVLDKNKEYSIPIKPKVDYKSLLKGITIKKEKGELVGESKKEFFKVNTSIDYDDINYRMKQLMINNEEFKIKKDIVRYSSPIIREVFKDINDSMMEEILRIVNILIQKLVVKKTDYSKRGMNIEEFDSLFAFSRILYIVTALQNIERKRSLSFYLDLLKKYAADSINTLGLNENNIKIYYLNAAKEIDKYIDKENIYYYEKKNEITRIDSSSKTFRKTEEWKEVYETFKKNIYSDKKRNNKIFINFKPISYVNKYKIIKFDKTLKTKLIDKTKNDLEYDINKFYLYYKYGCPKGSFHEWDKKVCKKCKITKEEIDEKDKNYYNKYKGNYSLLFKNRELIITKTKDVKQEEIIKKITEKEITNKVNTLTFLDNFERLILINLTRTQGLKREEILKENINELSKTNIHLLKNYLGGNKINIINIKSSIIDEYNFMLMKIIDKKKEEIINIINEEKKLLYVDINEIISKSGNIYEEGKVGEKDEVVIIPDEFIEEGDEIQYEDDDEEFYDELDYDGHNDEQ